MRRRSRSRSRPVPENALEEILAVAADSGDEAKLTRALARSELFVAQLPEHPLPVADGRDGNPVLIAFTSMAALLRWHTDDPTTRSGRSSRAAICSPRSPTPCRSS
jgi:hypothetical protein